VIQSLKSNLDEVVLGIIGDAHERQPFRLHLIAQAKGRDLDFGLFGL
jgi:hypothetical protein